MLASDKRKLNDSLCLKGWIKQQQQQQQLLFRLSKTKHSQQAAAAAVDEDLISLLMNDPLLFLSEAAEADCPEIQGKLRVEECSKSLLRSHRVIRYIDLQDRKQDDTS